MRFNLAHRRRSCPAGKLRPARICSAGRRRGPAAEGQDSLATFKAGLILRPRRRIVTDARMRPVPTYEGRLRGGRRRARCSRSSSSADPRFGRQSEARRSTAAPIRSRDDEETESARDDVRVSPSCWTDYHVRRTTSMSVRNPSSSSSRPSSAQRPRRGDVPVDAGHRLLFTNDPHRSQCDSAVRRPQVHYTPRKAFEQQYAAVVDAGDGGAGGQRRPALQGANELAAVAPLPWTSPRGARRAAHAPSRREPSSRRTPPTPEASTSTADARPDPRSDRLDASPGPTACTLESGLRGQSFAADAVECSLVLPRFHSLSDARRAYLRRTGLRGCERPSIAGRTSRSHPASWLFCPTCAGCGEIRTMWRACRSRSTSCAKRGRQAASPKRPMEDLSEGRTSFAPRATSTPCDARPVRS